VDFMAKKTTAPGSESPKEPRPHRRQVSPGHIFSKANRSKKKDENLTEQLIKSTVKKAVESRQLADPFADYYTFGFTGSPYLPIEPPENPNVMMRIPTQNNILQQCIECMVVNIEGTEHHLVYVGPDDDTKTGSEAPEAQAEFNRISGLMVAPNEEYDLCELRKRMRRDRETYGYAFMEVVRDAAGLIKAFYHIPANMIRITSPDEDPVRIPVTLNRENKEVKIVKDKYFRRYIQMDCSWSHVVFFKEFGDPRNISYKTGVPGCPPEEDATELLMFKEYRSGHLYGLPRWQNQIPSILGSREAELMNLNFFRDNAIPAMAVLVAGGYLSEDSVEAIADKFIRNRGRDKANEVLILEAYGDDQAAGDGGQMPAPKVEMKPLIDERQNDALFQDYDKACQTKIRCAFRLSPILIGLSDDYSYSTAYSGMVVAESQVFQPERNETDAFFNKYIFGDGVNPPKYWSFRSNPTRIVDADQVSKALTTLNNVGALTPNDALIITNQFLNMNIPPIPQIWGNYPMSMVLKLIEQGIPLMGMEDLVDSVKQMKFMQMELDAKATPNGAITQQKAVLDSTIDAFDNIINHNVE
jgi:PBSX family phage portal protein